MKPIDKLTGGECENFCKYCRVGIWSMPIKIWCAKITHYENHEGIEGITEVCTVEDWAVCPLNKPEPVFEWQWIYRSSAFTGFKISGFHISEQEFLKSFMVGYYPTEYFRIEDSKRERKSEINEKP